jgi:hypothetical protein
MFKDSVRGVFVGACCAAVVTNVFQVYSCTDVIQKAGEIETNYENDVSFYERVDPLRSRQELSYESTREILKAFAEEVPVDEVFAKKAHSGRNAFHYRYNDSSIEDLYGLADSYRHLFCWHWKELVSFCKTSGDLSLIAQSMKNLPFILTHCCEDVTFSYSDNFRNYQCPFKVEKLCNTEFLKQLINGTEDQPAVIYLRTRLQIAMTNVAMY